MAGKSTISITFKLDGDNKGFKDLAKDAEGLKQVISSTISEAQQLNAKSINFAALATGINAVRDSMNSLNNFMHEFTAGYVETEELETKLSVVMQKRMQATDAEVDAVKELTMAQRDLGVIDDVVQVAGLQQLSTFLKQKDSINALLPAMNNLLAQQKGMNATTSDAVNVGNLMGKVMMGQTAALTRVGITFDEAEEKVLKYGTEEERAAMLAEVITNNVGNMNAELGKLDTSPQQQLSFILGDIQDAIAEKIYAVQPFLSIAASATTAASGVATLVAGIKTLSVSLYANMKAFALSTVAVIKNKAATLAAAAAQKVVTAATAAWSAVQKVLNLIMSANPIGIVIVAIGALVTAVIAAYNHFEGFRKICDSVWAAIKPLANAIMNGLAKAFEWLVEKLKLAWGWLKKLLGFGGKKAEVEVEVKETSKNGAPKIDLSDTKNKYANYKPTTTGTVKAGGSAKVSAKASEGLIGQLEEKINAARERLREATSAAAIEAINKEIETYESELSKYENLGKKVADAVETGVEDNGPIFKADAANLADISDNISILNDQLQTANISEAAVLNQQIEAWNRKADAIRNAGKEADRVTMTTREALGKEWGATKQIGGAIEGITESLKGNGNAWRIVTGIVDGFISLYEGIRSIVSIIQLMTGASAAHAAAKGVEAGAETTEAGVRATSAATNAAASAAVITSNKLEAASWKELAAAEYMAAHAYIPFAGFGIAAGFVTAMQAMVAAAGIPMLAKGGIATGPTLAMVGEYAGASGNPEVIAPLDKLRNILSKDSGSMPTGNVEFRIEGRTLVGILNKENSITSRR